MEFKQLRLVKLCSESFLDPCAVLLIMCCAQVELRGGGVAHGLSDDDLCRSGSADRRPPLGAQLPGPCDNHCIGDHHGGYYLWCAGLPHVLLHDAGTSC